MSKTDAVYNLVKLLFWVTRIVNIINNIDMYNRYKEQFEKQKAREEARAQTKAEAAAKRGKK